MRGRKSDEELELQAIELVAKLATTEPNAAQRSSAQLWRSQSPRHERGWRKAEDAWALMAGLTADSQAPWRSPMAQRRIPARLSRKRISLAAGAAVAATLLLVLFSLVQTAPRQTPAATQLTSRSAAPSEQRWQYTSAAGQRRKVTLADGSVMQLNASTTVEVRFAAARRRVHLRRGEALFEVAKNPAAPFTVEVDAATATALGTVFMVRRLPQGSARITVLEGHVAVSAGADTVELHADEAVESGAAALGERYAVDAQNAASWQRGVLIFREQRLADVVAEIDRYTPYRLEAELGSRGADTVTGTFFIDRPDESLSGLIEGFGLAIVASDPGRVRLAPARPQRPAIE